MYLINTIPFLRRHFSERLLDSISFIVRKADLPRRVDDCKIHYSEKMLIYSLDILSP